MSDITDIRDPPKKPLDTQKKRLDRERQRVSDSLRDLAAHVDAAPREQLVHVLPITEAAIGELRRRLSPWLR